MRAASASRVSRSRSSDRRAFQQLIERPVPLGFDPLHDAPATAGRLGEPHLERVALLVRGFERAARVPPRPARRRRAPARRPPGTLPRRRPRAPAPAAATSALRAGLAPFRLLRRERGCRPDRAARALLRARGLPPRLRRGTASARSSRSSAERRPPATWASCTCQWTRCSRAASCSASSSASRPRDVPSSSSSRPRASSPSTSAASISASRCSERL